MTAISPVTEELTPTRPRGLEPPPHVQRAVVEVDVAHLANPVIAVARLLTSEAGAFARVTGDDSRLVVEVALPDDTHSTRRQAADWIAWAVHCAGIRGRTRLDPVCPD